MGSSEEVDQIGASGRAINIFAYSCCPPVSVGKLDLLKLTLFFFWTCVIYKVRTTHKLILSSSNYCIYMPCDLRRNSAA